MLILLGMLENIIDSFGTKLLGTLGHALRDYILPNG